MLFWDKSGLSGEFLVCWHSKDCTGTTFSIIIVPPFMISFNHSSYVSFMELHLVNDIMVFCLYCLNIKIIFVITKLVIRSALAWLRFFLSFPLLPPFVGLCCPWGVGLGDGECLPGGGKRLGAS